MALGSDFEAGVTYTVRVNDRETSFTTEPETTEVPAPIDGVELNIDESDPPQYFLEVTSGLPDACHTFDRIETQRSRTEITVTVINLGSDFLPDVTYTALVNDEGLIFAAL